MKTRLFLTAICAFAAVMVHSQGVFLAWNGTAPTRINSIDGPLAGTNIYGQMLAGSMPSSLTAVGIPVPHFTEGGMFGGRVTVPGIPAGNACYVQMVAWDSNLWGTMLAGIPADQLGRTDIVRVPLTTGIFPDGTFIPRFTQPAIVPIPEPSVWALGVLAGCLALVSRFARRGNRHPK